MKNFLLAVVLVTGIFVSGCVGPSGSSWYPGPLKRADGSEVVAPSYQQLPPMPPQIGVAVDGGRLTVCAVEVSGTYSLCEAMLAAVEARRESWVPTAEEPVYIRNGNFGAQSGYAIRERRLQAGLLTEGYARVCPFCGGCLVLGGCR